MIVENLHQWHDAVCQRDGFICQLQISPDCKKDYSFEIYFNEAGRNQYVCGDHLKTQKAFPELKFDTNNGKCVCLPCHAMRHKGHDLPEGYLEPAMEEMKPEKNTTTNRSTELHTLPSGLKIRLRGYETLCKCGFIALVQTGKCMRCETSGTATQKEGKKEKKPKKPP